MRDILPAQLNAGGSTTDNNLLRISAESDAKEDKNTPCEEDDQPPPHSGQGTQQIRDLCDMMSATASLC